MAPFPRALAAPRGLAETFTRVADRVGLGIIVSTREATSLRGRIVFANAAASQLLGIARREILGQAVDATHFGSVVFCADETTDPMASDAERGSQGEIVRSDGQRISIRRTVTVTSDDARPLVVHFLMRIERVARVQRALLDSEQRFRRLMDIAPDGILILVGTRIVYANLSITRIHGYSSPQQLAALDLCRLYHEDDRELVERCLVQEPSGQAVQLRALRRDGRTLPVEMVLFRSEWDDGPAVLATVRDLAGRKIVQSQLVHTDRLAAVGTLAAGVAHEINNPLAYMLLNLQYLIREVPKLASNSDRVGHLLERLREARHGADRVVSIVKDLRIFSKFDADQFGPVDLRRVLMSASKVARTQLMDRGQIGEVYDEVRPAYGNSARLEQVFLNLLINAVQALPASKPESNRIVVRLREERRGMHDFVVVEVTDTGAGIPPENLNRVFDPFFTTKPVGLGTGLGLPICHSIVTRMGGAIVVNSAVGQGTTFIVALPIATAERIATPYSLSPIPNRSAARARILIVDDELPVASMLGRLLGEEHDVEMATSAGQALDLMAQTVFDVIFCDLLMPAMTGMDLFAEVAKRHPGQQAQIVFMTGGAFTPRAAQFLSQVTNPSIEKPFDLRAVRAILRELLAKAATRT